MSERDQLFAKLKEYEAKFKRNDAEIKMLKARLSRASKLESEYETFKEAIENATKENPAAIIIQLQFRVFLRRKRMREAIKAIKKAIVTI